MCVNDSNVNYAALELPMGGAKASGLGSRHGADGIRKYTQQQALLISRLHPKRDLHMYPYSERMTGVLGNSSRCCTGAASATSIATWPTMVASRSTTPSARCA